MNGASGGAVRYSSLVNEGEDLSRYHRLPYSRPLVDDAPLVPQGTFMAMLGHVHLSLLLAAFAWQHLHFLGQ